MLSSLPVEMWFKIFSYLDDATAMSLRSTCRQAKALIDQYFDIKSCLLKMFERKIFYIGPMNHGHAFVKIKAVIINGRLEIVAQYMRFFWTIGDFSGLKIYFDVQTMRRWFKAPQKSTFLMKKSNNTLFLEIYSYNSRTKSSSCRQTTDLKSIVKYCNSFKESSRVSKSVSIHNTYLLEVLALLRTKEVCFFCAKTPCGCTMHGIIADILANKPFAGPQLLDPFWDKISTKKLQRSDFCNRKKCREFSAALNKLIAFACSEHNKK